MVALGEGFFLMPYDDTGADLINKDSFKFLTVVYIFFSYHSSRAGDLPEVTETTRLGSCWGTIFKSQAYPAINKVALVVFTFHLPPQHNG